MALHRGMHRYQCESVIDTPGFPRSTSLQTQPREAYQPSERKTWLKQKARRQQPGGGSRKAEDRQQEEQHCDCRPEEACCAQEDRAPAPSRPHV